MKKLQIGGSFVRGLIAGIGLLACVTAAHAHPYAGTVTNFSAGGTNFVSFFVNEGGGTVSVVTYPSVTTNSLGTLAAGLATVALPTGDTSYAISVSKVGAGAPTQVSADSNFNVWDGGLTLRTIAINSCPKFGDAFGRIYVGIASSTVTDSQAGYKVREWGVYGLTPDMQQNAFFGGSSSNAIAPVYESFSMTFTANPANGAVFVMDGITNTWTNGTITDTLHQVAVTNSAAAAATNLAAWMNLNSNSLPASVTAFASNNVLYFSAYAQNVSGAAYFSFANLTGTGPFGNDFTTGNGGFGSGPYRIQVSQEDGTVYVTDSTSGNANINVFDRNMMTTTNKVWTVTGLAAGEAVFQHGYPADVAIRGSQANGNLQLWTADTDMAVPSYFNNTNLGTLGNGGLGNFGAAQETVVGDQNQIFRYDIGSSPYPVTNTPVWACTLGLDGGFPGQVQSIAIGPNTNFVYASFRRFNFSDGVVQAFRSDTGARVYTSLSGTSTSPFDAFADGGIVPPPTSNPPSVYAIAVSPDGRYIAALIGSNVSAHNRVLVANLVNGIPDESSIVVITNLPSTSSPRHLAWDAADNVYTASSGQTFTRCISLGITTTCITSNDITGTNGSFQLVLPPAAVTLANAGNASQNYGTPIAGAIAFNLSTNNLPSPVTVNFLIGGTATNGVNYNITVGNIGNGVIVTTNANGSGTVFFPAGLSPSGNWTANLTINPTPSPTVGPTLTVTATVIGGTTYIASSPLAATVAIANTGPQFFFISASTTATTMTRAIANDYAKFIITRWGDTNGPNNTAGHVTPLAITLTNFTLNGTAVYSTDYLAGVQKFNGGVPAAGQFAVTFNPGDVSAVCVVGLPVSHANVSVVPVTTTIIPSLTNSATGTNLTSQEGYSYTVNTATTTLTEFDNAQGIRAEVVVWSDPLTNSAATGYTVTFASTNLATNVVPPVVFQNYLYTNGGAANGSGANLGGAPFTSNSFDVQLGWPISGENAWEVSQGTFGSAYPNPPPSPVMTAKGWTNVLRMSIDKQAGSSPTMCGVNVFPTTQQFVGNYALRFDMYLSVWSSALNNFNPLNFPRQFAAFGVGTQGTNCDWRMSIAAGIPAGTGSGPTNADGIWYCIDAADQSLTPADFDAFASPALPNAGTADFLSFTAVTYQGVFKRPPFPTTDGNGAGTPINDWVSVSVETHAQTNVTLIIDSTTIFQNLAYTNNALNSPSSSNPLAGLWTNGFPMLGYLQPYPAQSDESAFVYYSNVRMVELSPYITQAPQSQLVLVGSNVTFASTVNYGSAGITNAWMSGTTAPTAVLATNGSAGTNYTDTVTLPSVSLANGNSNYWAVFGDQAGSVTSYVATLAVVAPPSNVASAFGSNATITVTSATRGLVLTFQWQTNGVNIANGTKYSGVTNASVVVANVNAADTAVLYDVVVSERLTNLINNLYVITNVIQTGTNITTPGAAITIATPPSGVTVTPLAQTNVWGSSAMFTASVGAGDAPLSYAWKRNGTNLANTTKYSGTNTSSLTISNLTQADSTNTYQVFVSNPGGSATNSPAASLVVFVPQPTLSSTTVGAGHVTIGFGSTNTFDKTNSFILQSAPLVTGPYTNTVTNVVFSGSAGSFSVTAPTNGDNMFYRLLHVN